MSTFNSEKAYWLYNSYLSKEIEILWRGNTAIISGSMIVETVQNQLENY